MQTVRVLGIPMFSQDIKAAKNNVLTDGGQGKNLCVSATGAHGLVYSKTNSAFRSTLESFYMNIPDGMPVVWVGRLKGAKMMRRCYGPDFFRQLMIDSSNTHIRHFLCGGKEGVANRLKQVCEQDFGAKVVGIHCPAFLDVDDYNYPAIAAEINEVKANIIWIGLSTPKQEIFASKLAKHTNADFVCCVGAAFDFHIGQVRQAPSWIQKIGMEWFFRLLMEPKRLWKRYFEIVPLFIYYNFAELIRGQFFRRKK